MQHLDHVIAAFGAVLQFHNLILMIVGVVAGLIAGAIPGFTIAMAIVLTLPFTFGMPPVQGLSTMLGVYVGGLSGGLMSAILTGIPGHAIGGCHHLRRLHHGARRQAGPGARHRRVVVVLRRAAERGAAVGAGAAARAHRARVRPVGLLLAGRLCADHRRQPVGRGSAEGPDRRRVRHPGCQLRRGPGQWRRPLHLRHRRARARLCVPAGARRAVRLQPVDVRRARSRVRRTRRCAERGATGVKIEHLARDQGDLRTLGALAALLV